MTARLPESIEGIAFNPVPDSENEIHGDEGARQHGFRGGLVPGVTVSAYVCDPAVRAFGMDFLARGSASIAVQRPLYDRGRFRVELFAVSEHGYVARLFDAERTLCAEGRVSLPRSGEAAESRPVRRGDPPKPKDRPRPPATRENLLRLRDAGMWSTSATWSREAEIWSYTRDPTAMPELLRYDEGGYANMAFLLGLTNWHLASNVRLGPWLHLQTDSQCYEPVERDTKLVVEGAVVQLFERKGHHFVDLDVAAYRRDDSVAVMAARLRAIYQLRV